MADIEENIRQTPAEIYKAILQTLKTDTKRISLVKRDQELILDDWKIYFALDPYDISEFCFPFSDNLLRSVPEIEEISRLQNGRYEAMYNVENRPVLLQPYETELKDILDWASWSQFVVTESEILDDYLRKLDIETDADPDATKDVLEILNDKDISSLIAVVTGIISIGFKRLSEIVHNLSLRGSLDNNPRKRLFLRRRVEVERVITKTLKKYFKVEDTHRSPQALSANNRRDAQAFDQLLQLNEIYNKEKKLILYFSSAPKSLFLDEAAELKEYYPQINGQPYQLVRTATDLFVYMVYKGDSRDTQERSGIAKNRLNRLEKLIETIAKLGDAFEAASHECRHCNIDPKEKRCKYGVDCETIKEFSKDIEEKQNLNVNYSLHKRLAEALKETENRSTPEKYKELLKLIKEIQTETANLKATDQETEVTLLSLFNRANLVSQIAIKKKREGDQKVSCYLNSYPVFLSLKDEKLKHIFEKVVSLFNYGWANDAFGKYVNDFFKLDRQSTDKLESELLGCLLHLILGETNRATRQAEKYLHDKKISDEFRREFRYVLCFILWAAGNHREAIELAREGIALFADDGRFSHCRSVITLSLVDKQPEPEYDRYKTIVADTKDALSKFSKAHDLPMLSHRLGVCHNNLAYYLSESDFKIDDVSAAEGHLRELTKEIPEDFWDPAFPEFFHTKGCVLYSKFLESPSVINRESLDEAFRAAKKALILFPSKKEHKELVKKIINAYEWFKIVEPISESE